MTGSPFFLTISKLCRIVPAGFSVHKMSCPPYEDLSPRLIVGKVLMTFCREPLTAKAAARSGKFLCQEEDRPVLHLARSSIAEFEQRASLGGR
jgi:hypothetical protein